MLSPTGGGSETQTLDPRGLQGVRVGGTASKSASIYIEVQDQVKIGRPHERKFCHATLKLIKNVLTGL